MCATLKQIMAGQWLLLFFLSSGGAVALLFGVVLWQQRRIKQLEHSHEKTSRAFAKKVDSTSGHFLKLLERAPFPGCFVDHSGTIREASRSFKALAPGAETLEDFDRMLQVGLNKAKRTGDQKRVSFMHDGELRTFTLVAWPVPGRHEQLGTMYALLEHTAVSRHTKTRYEFEEELLALQAEITEAIVKQSGLNPTVALLAQELVDLSHFLKTAHQTHQPNERSNFDVAALVRDLMSEYRGLLRKKEIAITATLPHSLHVRGNLEGTRTALSTLLMVASEHARPHNTIRLHAGAQGQQVVVTISLPSFPAGDVLRQAFAFGKSKQDRPLKARLAIARLLLSHQHNSLTFTVDENGVAVAAVHLTKARR